jgi:hypothetical protein
MDFKTLGLVIFLSLFIALLIILVTQGINAMSQLFIWVIIGGVMFVILCLVVFAVWYLKFYHPVAILNKIVFDNKLKSAHLTKSPHLRRLGVSGDKFHQGVYFGNITGWASQPRILDPEDVEWKVKPKEKPKEDDGKKKGNKEGKKKNIKAILLHESYFAFKPFGWLSFIKQEDIAVAIEDAWEVILDPKGNIAGEPVLIPDMKQHSPLAGDVDIYTVSLTRVNRYLYPSQYAASPMIDKIQMGDTFRQFGHYSQDELAGAVDRAMKSNYQLQIDLQLKKLVDLSRSLPSQQPQGGGTQ